MNWFSLTIEKAGDFMRIERQFPHQNPGLQKAAGKTAEGQTFQQALAKAAPKGQDTLTISYQPPAQAANVPEKAAPDGIKILPGDSTETKLEKLSQIADSADYSGMSYTEIYCTIWDRYNSAFGGNMSAITSGLWCPTEWNEINNQFGGEIMNSVYHPLDKEVWQDSGLRRGDPGFRDQRIAHGWDHFLVAALGYDSKNYDDCEQAILQRYAGRNSLLDFLNMQGELLRTGVIGHKLGSEGALWYEQSLKSELKKMFFPDPWAQPSQEAYDSVLYRHLDINALTSAMRKSLSQANFSGFNFDMEEVMGKAIDDLLSIVDEQKRINPKQDA